MNRKLTTFLLFTTCLLLARAEAPGQTKIYRGVIGDNHVEMRLDIAGNKVTGNYSYDRFRQDIKLNGQLDSQGRLELFELGQNNKPAAKIRCKYKLDDSVDSECRWSRMDNTRETFVLLTEQHLSFTGGLAMVPKTIIDRALGARVSYPQLLNSGNPLNAGAQGFNRAALGSVQKAIKAAELEPGSVYSINYTVLLGTNGLISVEFTEDSYFKGAAHPNVQYWAITYDLNQNKELKLDDLFKPDSEYRASIAKQAVAYINQKADALDKAEAERAGGKREPRDGPLVSEEELNEPSSWGMTPKGLMIYFDFPHVMAFFDKTFVPYRELRQHFRSDGPAAAFQ